MRLVYTNLPVMEACLEATVHYTDMGGLFHTTRKQLKLNDRFVETGLSAVLETVEKIRVLADFGFAGREPVQVKGQPVVPRDLLVALMSGYVPPITDFLAPPKNRPPDWVKEIVTEVRGTKDGRTYLLNIPG